MRAFEKLRKNIFKDTMGWVGLLCIVLLGVLVLLYGYKGTFGGFLLALVLGVFLTLVAIAALVIYFIMALASYTKARSRLLAVPGFSEARFQRETERAPRTKNLLLCCDAICYYNGHAVKTIPIREIVWAYQEQDQNGACLKIYTEDGTDYQVQPRPCRKSGTAEALCRYILRLIARKNKGALIGYEESYDELRKRDFKSLVMRTRGREPVDSGLLEQEYIQNNYYAQDLQ